MATEAKIVLSADDRASRVLAGLKANLGSVSGVAAGVASSLGLIAPALSAGAFTAFVRSTAAGIEKLKDLSEATGSSVENISALEDVAARTGTSFDAVGTALIKYNKSITEAQDPTSDAARVFKELGLDVKELARLDPSQGLLKTAKALDGFAEGAGKGRAELQLLDKSTRELAPFLKDLAEQGELNAKVTKAQADEAERFNNQLSSLAKNATDFARSIVSSLLPALNNLFDQINKKGFGAALTEQLSIGVDIQKTRVGIAGLTAEIERLQKQIDTGEKEGANAFARLAGKDASEKIHTLTSELAKLRAEEKRLLDARFGRTASDEAQRKIEDRGFTPAKPELNVPGKKADKEKEKTERIDEQRLALAAYVKTLESELDKTKELSSEQEALNKLKSLGTLGELPQVRALVLGLAEQNDALRDQEGLRKLNAEAEKELAKQQKETADFFDQASGRTESRLKQLRTSQLEAILQDTPKAFSEAELDRIVKGIAGINDEIEKTDDFAATLGLTFASSFEQAILAGSKFSDLLQSIAQDILKLFIRKQVTEPLANQLGALFKGFSLLGSADGNAFDRAGVTAFARGGIVDRPTIFPFANGTGLMGEAGPEAILPLTRRGGRLGVSGGGGTVNVTQNISIGAGVSPSQLAQGLAQAKEQAKAEIADQMRRGSRAYA